MFHKKDLWRVQTITSPEHVAVLSTVFEEQALAMTVSAPPRKAEATIEWIFDNEPDQAQLTAELAIIAMMNGIPAPSLTISEVPKLDWLKKVAEDFPPLPIGRWTIHGAQHRHKVPDRRLALQIDATSAFGTGEHPTTRGCLLMLEQVLKKDYRCRLRHMLDMGCGSGILAMAFAKNTHGSGVGVDMDTLSVNIARRNRNSNGLSRNLGFHVGCGYKLRCVKRSAPYDLIMSNIFAGPLAQMAKDLKRHLRPGGTAILAGLLNHQANRVINAHRLQGLTLQKRLVLGEWTILVLHRPTKA